MSIVDIAVGTGYLHSRSAGKPFSVSTFGENRSGHCANKLRSTCSRFVLPNDYRRAVYCMIDCTNTSPELIDVEFSRCHFEAPDTTQHTLVPALHVLR